MTGSVQVSVSLSHLSGEFRLPLGALWALAGAFLYACYIVLLRARVDHEDKLDLPMFFGKEPAVWCQAGRMGPADCINPL